MYILIANHLGMSCHFIVGHHALYTLEPVVGDRDVCVAGQHIVP